MTGATDAYFDAWLDDKLRLADKQLKRLWNDHAALAASKGWLLSGRRIRDCIDILKQEIDMVNASVEAKISEVRPNTVIALESLQRVDNFCNKWIAELDPIVRQSYQSPLENVFKEVKKLTDEILIDLRAHQQVFRLGLAADADIKGIARQNENKTLNSKSVAKVRSGEYTEYKKRGPKSKVDPREFEQEVHRLLDAEGIVDPKLDPNFRQSNVETHMLNWHREAIQVSRNRELTAAAIRSYRAKFEAYKGQ